LSVVTAPCAAEPYPPCKTWRVMIIMQGNQPTLVFYLLEGGGACLLRPIFVASEHELGQHIFVGLARTAYMYRI